ncbi:sugar phosphate isomerase/epimerase family protein [Nocardia sp. NPDC004582]
MTDPRPAIGADTSKYPRAAEMGAVGTLEHMRAAGLRGAFFRSPFELSATLDPAELASVTAAAAELGMYVEVGVAKCNPYATPEAPRIRAFGDGSYRDGMIRIIEALAAAGITELWTATANYQFTLPGLYACDRFRTDVDWSDQLAATQKYLRGLAPVLRGTGAHLNIETHEEITSWETVRLVETAGPDVFGITFDCANVVARGEDPTAAAARVAPYVRQTHLRDVVLLETEAGYSRFVVPAGAGFIDWPALLAPLLAHNPALNLSIEGVSGARAEMTLFIHDERWVASHTDLTAEEFAALRAQATRCAERAAGGTGPTLADLRNPTTEDEESVFFADSARVLRAAASACQEASRA